MRLKPAYFSASLFSILGSITFVLFLCSATYGVENNRDLLRKSDSIGTVVDRKVTYYIVEVTDLRKARKSPPTYVGTIEGYHLFRVWLKIRDVPDEISFFAVKRDACNVEDEKSPEDERTIVSETRKEWRNVEFKSAKCFVRGR